MARPPWCPARATSIRERARTARRALLVLAALGSVLLWSVPPVAAQTPPGDHYFCYKASLAPKQPKFAPAQKTLEDQIDTLIFDAKKIAGLCNPAQEDAESPPAYPTVHQVGYQIQLPKTPPQPKFVKSDHVGIDEFGSHALTLVKPVGLLVPSAKVPGSGGTGVVDTSGVDHFECYKVARAKGAPAFVPPPPTVVTDEFGSATYNLTKITKVCTPVDKNGEDSSAPSHAGHLVCYQAKLVAGQFTSQTVSTNNTNFGPAVLVAKSVAELCVPAFKDTVPTTSTSTSTTSSTSSSTSTSSTTSTSSSTSTTSTSTTTSTTTTTLCTPTTCGAQGASCGSIPDGCGGMLDCGTCTAPQTCGGGGTPNVCGCTPTTCAAQGANCGSIADGCGGTLDCGTCTAPRTCGGGGTTNVCGAPCGTFITKWGSQGTGNGSFNAPTGVGLDGSGDVYVADDGNNRIQKFTTDGTFLTTWGSGGSGDGQFSSPTAVTVDANGNVFVSDEGNDRIQVFTETGTFLRKWGSMGNAAGQFANPRGVAVDGSSGNVFVVDESNDRIQVFTNTGTFVTTWGTTGSGDGQFNTPIGVALDASGNVYVADFGNYRIQKFTASGTFLAQWGNQGSGDGQFNLPIGDAVGGGNVFVVEESNFRVQEFTTTGTFLALWGSPGSGNGQFSSPFGMAADGNGNVFVADTFNYRIQKFACP